MPKGISPWNFIWIVCCAFRHTIIIVWNLYCGHDLIYQRISWIRQNSEHRICDQWSVSMSEAVVSCVSCAQPFVVPFPRHDLYRECEGILAMIKQWILWYVRSTHASGPHMETNPFFNRRRDACTRVWGMLWNSEFICGCERGRNNVRVCSFFRKKKKWNWKSTKHPKCALKLNNIQVTNQVKILWGCQKINSCEYSIF